MNSESGICAMGEVVMNLVWKHLHRGPSAGKMHCTSTTMASQAPVSTTFSCCRKLPAMGMPWRMATSLAVQHTPAMLMPLAPMLLGQSDHLGILGVEHDHFGQGRIVAVDNDVDHVLLHDADVGGGVHGLGGAEQDVGELGAHHGSAPAVGQTGAQGLADQSLGQGGAAHVRHVQGLGNLAVDGAGLDACVDARAPDGVLRGALQEALHAEGLAVFHQAGFGDLVGHDHRCRVPSVGMPHSFAMRSELLGILDRDSCRPPW